MFELLVLGIASLANVALGLTVYYKKPKSATSRLFLLLTFSFVLWSTVNYISVHPVLFSQVVWVRLVLFCAALLCLSVFLTFTVFPSTKMVGSKRVRKIAIGYTAFVMLFVMTPYVFMVNSDGDPVPNKGIVFFTFLVIGLIGGGILTLAKKYRTATGRTKNQLRLVIFGLVGTFGLIFVNNFLLVVVFNFTALIPAGPVFTLVFSGSIAYAIIKHRLFDIRTAVARATAYALSLGSIVLVYSLVVFGISGSFAEGDTNSVSLRAFYIGSAVVTALFFSPLKSFFDKLTSRIFFRDTYDPQAFLDELNRLLVSQVELESLLESINKLFEGNLKSSFSAFVVRETAYEPIRIIGTNRRKFDDDVIANIRSVAPHSHTKVIALDELEDNDPTQLELRKTLEAADVGVVVRLVATLNYDLEGIGYIILGTKKNGNQYNFQDLRVLDIVANELVIAVENALRFEEIEKFNATLQEKVDDATKQLRRTNEKLKQLDETKDEFISMASHQLRTPLTSVKGYLSMVLEGDAGDVGEMQRKLLDQAYVSSQRMVYLIADLLNVSRLRTGKFIIETVASNLADVVEGEIGQLKETAAGRGLELTYDKPDNFPTLFLDETKLRQVIMNFTDNAIYYTPKGGHINVKLEDKGESIELTVKDDGMGVPKSEQPHLFTKFYRAVNAQKARPDGTGLGLFMAKKVIVAQGGSLIFSSQEGKGSTFGFSFPKSKLMTPPVSVAEKTT